MDSGADRPDNRRITLARVYTSQIPELSTATSQAFAARLAAAQDSWQGYAAMTQHLPIQTAGAEASGALSAAADTIPRSMASTSGRQLDFRQWIQPSENQSRSAAVPNQPRTVFEPIQTVQSQAATTSEQMPMTPQQQQQQLLKLQQRQIQQQQNNNLALSAQPTVVSDHTAIWRQALQMNPEERNIFLDEAMRRLAEATPSPSAEFTSQAQIQSRQLNAVPSATPSVLAPRLGNVTNAAKPNTSSTPSSSLSLPLSRSNVAPIATTPIPFTETPARRATHQGNPIVQSPIQLHPQRQRHPTSIITSPAQQSRSPAAIVSSSAVSTTADASGTQAVMQRLLPRGFVNEPRFVPRHVRHFSKTYEEEVKRYMIKTSAGDDQFDKVKVKMDPTPVPKLLQEAAGGIGRLAGLLPATDLLDREAHSTQTAIVTLVNALRETEINVASILQKNRQLEEQVTGLRKELNAYRPLLDAILQNLPQGTNATTSSNLKGIMNEQKAIENKDVEKLQDTSAQMKEDTLSSEKGKAKELSLPANAQALPNTKSVRRSSLDKIAQGSDHVEEPMTSSSDGKMQSPQQDQVNGTSEAGILERNGAGISSGSADQDQSVETGALEVSAIPTSATENEIENEAENETPGDVSRESRTPTPPLPPAIKAEESVAADKALLSPERLSQTTRSKSKEAELQGTPSRTLRSASQKANSPNKESSGAALNEKRKRMKPHSSFSIFKGNHVESINLDSSDEESDDEETDGREQNHLHKKVHR